jgi:hypothetical protein
MPDRAGGVDDRVLGGGGTWTTSQQSTEPDSAIFRQVADSKDRFLLFGLRPLRHDVARRDADSMTDERARQTATDAFGTYQGDNGVRLMDCY